MKDAKSDIRDAVGNAPSSAAADKAKGQTKQFVGKVKEKVGAVIGDDDLRAEGLTQRVDGKKDEIKGNIKEKIDDVKGAIKAGSDLVREKLHEASSHSSHSK